jgi:glucokinase
MILAIDLGGTKIKVAVVDGDTISDSISIDANSHLGFVANIPRLSIEIKNLLKKNKITGIGLATPGVVDSNNFKVLGINEKYADLVGLDLKKWATDSFNLPFALENDARAALLGEWKYGIGENCDNLLGITLGTGIGTAAIVDGRMLKGKGYIAGNLGGHMVLDRNGLKCNCGNIGCMEAQSSSWSLPAIIKNQPGYSTSKLKDTPSLDFKTLFTFARENDPYAKEIRDYCLEIWSIGISNLCFAFDPEMVILNGGIMASYQDIIPYIETRINQKNKLRPSGKIKVQMAKNKDTAALFGLQFLLER